MKDKDTIGVGIKPEYLIGKAGSGEVNGETFPVARSSVIFSKQMTFVFFSETTY